MRFLNHAVATRFVGLRLRPEVSFSLEMDLLFALLASFLPERYRPMFGHQARTYLAPAAGVTAFFETVIVSLLYARGLVDYFPSASIGPAAFLEYFFTWQGLLLAFFFLDGVLRLLAAIAGQALGIMPLYALVWIQDTFEKRAARKKQTPLVVDVMEGPASPNGELRICSCRPRRNWDRWMTVMYGDRLYEIARAEAAPPPRPYVYVLRPKPESKVIRGLHRYHPEEVFSLKDDQPGLPSPGP